MLTLTMILLGTLAGIPTAGCGATCPTPPAAEVADEVARLEREGVGWQAEVEVVDEQGRAVHRAVGALSWGEKVHLGGLALGAAAHDRPDYEIRAQLVAPGLAWTSL